MIYIILVNWRGYRDTIECLESLMRLEGPGFRIVIVDNESAEAGVKSISLWAHGELRVDTANLAWKNVSDTRIHEPTLSTWSAIDVSDIPPPSIERCRHEWNGSSLRNSRRARNAGVVSNPIESDTSLVTIVRVDDNSGFAAACNLGIRIALRDADCTHVWLLNNDTIVDPRALIALQERIEQDGAIGVCGSTLLYYDTPDMIQSLGGVFCSALGRGVNLGAGLRLRQLPPTELVEVRLNYVIGASMLVSRRFLEEVGPMEESYFLYFEELNWSRRACGRFKHAWARDSLVYHKEGASIGTNSRAKPSELSLYCYNLNYLRFLQSFHAGLLPFGLAVVISKLFIGAAHRDGATTHILKQVLHDFLWTRRATRDGVARLKQ